VTSEQWSRALTLVRSLSDHSPQDGLRTLNGLTEDPEVLEKVRQTLASLDAPDTQAVRSGMQLGRYLVGSPVGAGSYGEVYQGLDTVLNRTVALKFLPATTLLPKSAALSLVAEAQAASALNHPNIVTVHEVVDTEAGPVIVMEMVEGRSLRELLRESIPAQHARQYALQLLEALAAAHSKGIVHRDVKPENIMVRPDGYIKVLDFGLARQIEETQGGNPLWGSGPVGTLRYMSPEQCAGSSASAASDVFSAGLVICEMATGQHAFGGATPIETAELILREAPRPKTKGPLVNVALHLLAKNPKDRPTAAEALGLLKKAEPARRFWTLGIAAAVFTLAITVSALLSNRDNGRSLVNAVPLTSSPGWEFSPEISPDGQSVAYAWGSTGEINATSQIWLKRFDRDSPTKLLEAERGDVIGRPVWSADGKQILYKSENLSSVKGALWFMAVDGSARQKLRSLEVGDLSTGPAWSPDGSRIAYTERVEPNHPKLCIQILTLATGQVRTITSPPADAWGDWDPKFSPDGATIAFKRVLNYYNDQLFTVSVQGGTERQLTKETQGIWGHDWTLDGHRIILSSKIGGLVHGLKLLNVDRPGPTQAIREPGTGDAVMPASRASQVAWVDRVYDYNIYRVPLSGGRPSLVINSTSWDFGTAIAKDGRLAFASRRSGSEELWIAAPDGSQAVRVTDLKQTMGQFTWSPDGVHLLFESPSNGRSSLKMMDCEAGRSHCSSPTPVGDDRVARLSPSWSPDGRFIYFSTQFANSPQIFRMTAQGGPATRITQGSSGFRPRLSPDGKWLYFCKPPAPGRIWRIRLDSAVYSEEEVVGPPNHPLEGNFVVTNDEVIFVDLGDATHSAGIRAYNPASKQIRMIVQSNVQAPAISPDGRTLFYSQPDRSGGNVMTAHWNQ
jgi:serine/threonine protein kinase